MDEITWCIKKHNDTKHYYDNYLPYKFHLGMVVQVFEDFSYLLPKHLIVNNKFDLSHSVIRIACWGHDLIEDARVSYNDCVSNLGKEAADIIYAVTNEKGKTRKERANDKYYEGIRNTPGAVFVKLCDRIANVQYSKLTKSRMFEMYKEENVDFIKSLDPKDYEEMVIYLAKLFND